MSKLNPVHWFKKSPKTADEQLDANAVENKRLTSQLRAQGLLPKNTELKEVCSAFKDLGDCVGGASR